MDDKERGRTAETGEGTSLPPEYDHLGTKFTSKNLDETMEFLKVDLREGTRSPRIHDLFRLIDSERDDIQEAADTLSEGTLDAFNINQKFKGSKEHLATVEAAIASIAAGEGYKNVPLETLREYFDRHIERWGELEQPDNKKVYQSLRELIPTSQEMREMYEYKPSEATTVIEKLHGETITFDHLFQFHDAVKVDLDAQEAAYKKAHTDWDERKEKLGKGDPFALRRQAEDEAIRLLKKMQAGNPLQPPEDDIVTLFTGLNQYGEYLSSQSDEIANRDGPTLGALGAFVDTQYKQANPDADLDGDGGPNDATADLINPDGVN